MTEDAFSKCIRAGNRINIGKNFFLFRYIVLLILKEDMPTADRIEFDFLFCEFLLLIYEKDLLHPLIHCIGHSLDLH